MKSQKDFFFGNLNVRDAGISFNLRDIHELGRGVSPKFFTDSLNRLLRAYKSDIIAFDGTSGPEFFQFVERINKEDVGYIKIYSRTDINGSKDVIPCTLACDFVFLEGIVSIRPNWCAYREDRAEELIATLLKPLYLSGLHRKAFLEDEQSESSHLGSRWLSGAESIKNTLSLAKASPLCLKQDKIASLGHELDLAAEMSEQESSLTVASERLRAALRAER